MERLDSYSVFLGTCLHWHFFPFYFPEFLIMGPLSYIESASFIFLCRAGFEPGLIIIGK